jgi:YidC/Oxa1 family membrane protein insertase
VPTLHEVGYYKLDRVAEAHQSYNKKYKDRKTVLMAPSWGKKNFLESHGIELVERLLPLGARIVVRPHPCFFLPIYPEGRHVVDGIARRFEGHSNVVIERSVVTEDSFHEADAMISDFSGAAYEYALGTLRPVVFMDVPRKTLNPDWQKLGLPTFEDTMRREVGHVLSAAEWNGIDRKVAEMMENKASYRDRLERLRRSAIYNFGHSAEVGARIIDGRLRKKTEDRKQETGDSKKRVSMRD